MSMRRGSLRPAYLFVLMLLLIRVPACEYQEDQGGNTSQASLISVSPVPSADAGSSLA